MKKQIQVDLSIDVYYITTLSFTQPENVQRVVYALSLGGYFVRVRNESGSYKVEVFSHNPPVKY